MNRSKGPVFLPSILDRLIEGDSLLRAGGRTLDDLRETIRRDLETLFNTLPVIDESPALSPELQRSVLGYGFPDLTSLSGDPARIQRLLAQRVQSALARFEPRLRDVRVSPSETRPGGDGTLGFAVEASLTDSPEHRLQFSLALHSKGGHHFVA